MRDFPQGQVLEAMIEHSPELLPNDLLFRIFKKRFPCHEPKCPLRQSRSSVGPLPLPPLLSRLIVRQDRYGARGVTGCSIHSTYTKMDCVTDAMTTVTKSE